jgi:hypothetical protein
MALATGVASTFVFGAIGHAAVTPGTPKQVATLVAAAPSIRSLPSHLTPSLQNAANDTAYLTTPKTAGCILGGSELNCNFGDTKGPKTMVLVGDSHAYMWFPAFNAVAKSGKWKLVLLSMLGCPVANIDVWDPETNKPYTACTSWRSTTIARINKLDPALVVVAETHNTEGADQQAITNAQWQTAVEASLNSLDAKGMKKVLLSDTIAIPNPDVCLAANPTAVNKCSVPEANTVETAQRATDAAAAKAKHTLYINAIPWTCSKTCTAVIGNMVVYYSSQHLTATYDTYLTRVLRRALAPDMR